MKIITKLSILLGLIGCVAGLILCAANKVDFGTWDIPAFVCGIVFCIICMNWRGFLTFVNDNFEIEYTKEKGLSVKEEKKDK